MLRFEWEVEDYLLNQLLEDNKQFDHNVPKPVNNNSFLKEFPTLL